MTQYEYKVVKSRVVDQNYYTSWLAAYGWQVQNMQEVVDQVVNQSIGFSSNMGSGSMFGHAYYHPHTNTTAFSGYQTNHGWGTNMNTSVTNVHTKLTITFFRDINFPDRAELNEIEAQWWKCSERYLGKVIDRGNTKGEEKWPELVELKRIQSMAWEIRNRKKSISAPVQPKKVETAQKPPQQVQNKPIQAPNTPATATIKNMEVTHNVFQSDQPGIQIRLCFSIQNRKGLSCGVLAYFRDDQGKGLIDLNNKFKTTTGHVCVGSSCTPDFEDALFNDYILFLPYTELDQPDGVRKLQFNVQIYDDSGKTFIAASEPVQFTFTKSSSSMRGEATTTPASRIETQKPKTVNPQVIKKPTAPIRPGNSHIKVASTQTLEQRKGTFRERTNWAGQSETRKMFLDGVFLDIEGKHNEALKIFQKVLKLEPVNEEYIIQVSNTLFALDKNEESLKVLNEGLEKIPSSPKLQYWQALTFIRMKDYATAEKVITALTTSAEKSSCYYAAYSQAYLFETSGYYKSAIRFYDQADKLAEDPENNPLKGLGQKRCRDRMH